MLEKTLESPLDCKEIQPVHSEGDQPWDFFGRNDAKAETPVLWPPHAKSWLIGKDFDAGRDWGQEEKGKTEDEMAGWHHWLDGCESEWRAAIHGVTIVEHNWMAKLNWTEKIILLKPKLNHMFPLCETWPVFVSLWCSQFSTRPRKPIIIYATDCLPKAYLHQLCSSHVEHPPLPTTCHTWSDYKVFVCYSLYVWYSFHLNFSPLIFA